MRNLPIHAGWLLLATLLTSAPAAQTILRPGTVYFVSPQGNDLNSGLSPIRAWRTLGRVNRQFLVPGDTVAFQGGAAFVGTVELAFGESGTPADPITFTSFGSGPAAIVAGTGTGFDLYNVAGIRIADLAVLGAGASTNDGIGISFYADLPGDVKLAFVRIEDCLVSGFRHGGISIGAYAERTGFEDVRVEGCRIESNGRNGLAMWGFYLPSWGQSPADYAHHGVYVGHNLVRDNRGDAAVTSTHTGSGIEIAQAYSVLVEHNEAFDNGADNRWAGGGPVGIWLWDVLEGVVQYNESHHNRSGTLDGGGFDLDGGCVRCVLQYNYSHDNEGPGFMVAQFPGGARPLRRCTVRYNVSERDGGRGGAGALQLWSGDALGAAPNAIVFHNNTIYVEPKALGTVKAFRAFGPGQFDECGLANNVFFADGSGAWLGELALTAPPACVGNLYHAPLGPFVLRDGGVSFSSLAAWRAARGQELVAGLPTGYQLDPQLTAPGLGGTIGDTSALASLSAYRLLPTSPLPDLGLFLPSFGVPLPPTDFYGQPVPSGAGVSIGADEAP